MQSIIRGNKFHMLMFHLARAKTSVGANLNTIDTQDSESCHKDFVKRPHQVSSYLLVCLLKKQLLFLICRLKGDIK